jgi:hypothetical protein
VTLAGLATYFFWIEYLPPFTRVHVYSDIEGFHWPLLVSAFETIRHGHFPLWDPSIYCGMPFAGNIQAALFYPPTWLLFAANIFSRHVLFKSLEVWVFLHGWLAFCLCYVWLRGRNLPSMASVLGAMVFAYGGYMVSQNTHVGIVTGYCWTPLAWFGIDQAFRASSWRPMWKVAVASGLCFLAGYPPSFLAFVIATLVYAAARSWRCGLATVVAIAASLALASVELLPAAEASALKTFDPKYGPGIHDPLFYIHFAVPDWIGMRFGDPHLHLYLYLGVPVLFGAAWLVKLPDRSALAVLGACALFLTNPYDVISGLVSRSALLVQIFPMLSFVEPATLVFGFVAANGIDAFLRSGKPSMRLPSLRYRVFAFATATLLVFWSVYRLRIWPQPLVGWRSAFETSVMLVLFTAGLLVVRRGTVWMAVLLCAAVFIDYKVCGTSRPFSALPGDVEPYYPRGRFPGLDLHAYDTLREHREYRLAVDRIQPTDLRRYGLSSPQGFDPLLPNQFKVLIEQHKPFRTNRLFDIQPADTTLARLLGVRYFLTSAGDLFHGTLANGEYRLVGRRDMPVQVYEYVNAAPAWRWEGTGGASAVRWEPELREFEVDAGRSTGRFVLIEQFYPGWRVSIDAHPVPMERWNGAFQSVVVPPGSHVVRFEYRPSSVIFGLAMSSVSLSAFAAWLWLTRIRQRVAPASVRSTTVQRHRL